MTALQEIPYFEDDDFGDHPEWPTVERQTINAIVYDSKQDAVLCLDWGSYGWKGLVVGGIEKGQDTETAARAEVREETGYIHLEYVANVGKTKNAFLATHKKENRIAYATGVLFLLESDTKETVDPEELAKHTPVWIQKDKVLDYLNIESQQYMWERALEILQKSIDISAK